MVKFTTFILKNRNNSRMKTRHYLTIVLLSLTMLSFENGNRKVSSEQVTGIYGDADGTDVNIQLTIKEDFSFRFIHNCNPNKPIDVRGAWILLNNTVILKDYKSDVSINKKWKIDNNSKCLKSRHGMEFIRICQASQ